MELKEIALVIADAIDEYLEYLDANRQPCGVTKLEADYQSENLLWHVRQLCRRFSMKKSEGVKR